MSAWAAFFILAASSATMLAGIAADEVNIVLTSICQMLIGFAAMLALLSSLKQLGEVLSLKNASERNAFLTWTIGLSGLLACVLCFLSDFLYYMNRNTLVWVYLESSAFPLGFLLINATLQYFTGKLWPVGDATSSQRLGKASEPYK